MDFGNFTVTIVEDVGGATVPGTNAKIPNSFVYQFVPINLTDLTKGKLQALQASSNTTGQPITFQPIDATHPQGHAFSPDQKALPRAWPSTRTHWPRRPAQPRSSGPRTGSSARAATSRSTSSTRPATPTPSASPTRTSAAAVTQSYAGGRQPLRFLAEGRDPSATL